MTNHTIVDTDNELGPSAILIHLGLLIFGLSAGLTGLLADDYKKIEHLGFTVHSWLGIGLAFFAGLRFLTGIAGPRSLRFTRWLPITAARLKLAAEDLAGLLKFRMPERPTHQGLAGVVETFGLAVFFLLAATGVYLYLFLEPGRKALGLVHDVKELHEIGAVLIPAFLSMHAGAVILHALQGKHLWRKMFFISDRMEQDAQQTEALPDER
jgi:Ni/Fe-hydrogenase 1 B-type cytochrome subunit